MLKITTKDNFIYLTFALTTLLLSTAISQQFFSTSTLRLTQSSTVMALLITVWGTRGDGITLGKALFWPSLIVASSLTSFWLENGNLAYVHLIFMLCFFILTAYKTAKQVLLTGKINGNKILGSICLYMLFGLIWALMYTLLELNIPGSFKGITTESVWYELLPTFVYFSFVTLTTLGYGDISPNLPIGQFLVYFQALVGQFYIAILVASIVGAHVNSMHDNEEASTQTPTNK